ncbi:MAG: hypothetical protein HOQ44_11285 [Nocardia sp.]|nr:hypothetical protein [Nocardia sp.]
MPGAWTVEVVAAAVSHTDDFLHAHIRPRFDWEPDDLVRGPVWLYPRDRWTDPLYRLGPGHEPVRSNIGAELDRLGAGRPGGGPP